MEPRLTVDEVAAIYRVSRETIIDWAREGYIPHIQPSRKVILFVPSELEKWEKRKSQAGRVSRRKELAEIGA